MEYTQSLQMVSCRKNAKGRQLVKFYDIFIPVKRSFLCNPLRWVGAPGNTPLLDPMYSICISNMYGVTFPDLDAVALPHGDPHGHGDRRDEAAEDVQQGETEALPVFLAG